MKQSCSGRRVPFLGRNPTIVAIALGLILAGAVAVLAELGFRFSRHFFGSSPPTEFRLMPGNEAINDPFPWHAHLGYAPRPKSQILAVKRDAEGRTIYRAAYSFDDLGRRVAPLQSATPRPFFVMVFGCSIAFGEGLNDVDTVAYNLGKRAHCYEPYSYALPGYGPQQMLVRLRDPSLRREIPQKTGIILCFGAFVSRAVGAFRVYSSWAHDFPCFELDSGGELTLKGSFFAARLPLSLLYEPLARSALARSLAWRMGAPDSDQDVKLTATIVKASFDAARAQFPDSKFYFCNLPARIAAHDDPLVRVLRQLGVPCLDYGNRAGFDRDDFSIKGDGHPSALWTSRMAEILVDDLGIRRSPCGNQ